jgi:hypothetical protein
MARGIEPIARLRVLCRNEQPVRDVFETTVCGNELLSDLFQ